MSVKSHSFLNESGPTFERSFVRSFVKEVTVKQGEKKVIHALPLNQERLGTENLAVLLIVQYGGRYWT